MNFLAFNNFQQSQSKNVQTEEESAKKKLSLTILNMLNLVLTYDFERFTRLKTTQTMLDDLKKELPQPPITITRSASQPETRKARISRSQPQSKPSQKSQTTKKEPSPKPVPPKNQSSRPPVPPAVPKSSKEVQSSSTVKTSCSKLKKKIHKVPEVRKEHGRRIQDVCISDMAEMPRMGFSDKQKKKIRRQLLIRRVQVWNQKSQSRREARELRNSQ